MSERGKNDFGPAAIILALGIAIGFLIMAAGAGIGHHKARGAETTFLLGMGILDSSGTRMIAHFAYGKDHSPMHFETLDECQAVKGSTEFQENVAELTKTIKAQLGDVHVITACMPWPEVKPDGTDL